MAKRRIPLFLFYFLFWYLFFILSRILFLLYHFQHTESLSFTDICKTFLYGSRMDLSMAGYISIIPGLVFLVSSFFRGKVIATVLNAYTTVILFVTTFLVVADLELYRNWGFRMDTTPLMYLKSPKEAIASMNGWLSLILLLFSVFLFWYIRKVYLKTLGKNVALLKRGTWKTALAFIPLTGILILPIRGGLDVAPMNTSFVYFHKTNVFANHAAINVVWNLGNALSADKIQGYDYFDAQKAKKIFDANRDDKGQTKNLLNTPRPNIIIFVMESFTSKIIERLGGLKGITPNFSAFCKEGILFDNCYASGDRTDKGIISVLSGYPALPKFSVINFSKKTEKLPFLNQDLRKLDYYSEFVYGGDIDFANFRSYFMNAIYDKVISKADFNPALCKSKWGAHDHVTFDRLLDECNKASHQPFFFTCLSQSSHEPFDVPMQTVIPGLDEEHRYLNSAYYADSSLGDFMRKAQKTSWWKNTLVIVVADHGSRLPGNTCNFVPLRFHIPLLWLGGAVASKDTVIHTYCAQYDIPLTLLHQLGLDNKAYRFSKDILSTQPPAYGFYVFNDGFGYVKKDNKIVFDNVTARVISSEGNVSSSFIEEGKALMQVLSEDFVKR